MIKVFTVAEMVAAEKASDAAGNSYDEMMEKAGRAVAVAIIERRPVAGQTVTILVGPGNNGGDGLVAGRYLAQAGASVTFYLYRERDPLQDHNLAQVQEMALPVLLAAQDQGYQALRAGLEESDIVIDALLGTGVSRPIGGGLAGLMEQAQAALRSGGAEGRRGRGAEERRSAGGRLQSLTALPQHLDAPTFRQPYTVAVDCPSGLNCDSGELDKLAFPADLTVTFAGPKRGHFIFPGAGACGELVVADIDISLDLPEVAMVKTEVLAAERARALLPIRRPDGHKGTFGWALIAAGSSRYWGAPALAGRAAYRTGSGLVALAVPGAIRPALATQLPEATYPIIQEQDLLGADAARAVLEQLSGYQALLVGPGLNQATEFMETLLAGLESVAPRPMIVDADGLNLLSAMDDWPKRLPANTVLTPHPGEMARLMDVSLGEVNKRDRVALAAEKAAEWDCVVLLKGAHTVIAASDGRCAILPFANPALATAGSGDVLSGVIVSLLGQGLAPFEAA
ncbi:MAG: NAD(P)H-hydrate dehydratase, partial [Chloroflexota bacterium]